MCGSDFTDLSGNQNWVVSLEEFLFLPFCLKSQMYDAFPWLMHHLPGPHQKVFAYNDFMHHLVMKEVQAHERQQTGASQDLIDFYLAQITKVSICLLHSSLSLSSMPTTHTCCSNNCYRIFICMLYVFSN